MYFRKKAPLRLLLFLAPDVYKRNRTRKNQYDTAPCFHLGPTKVHPSGTAQVPVKGPCSVAITRDITWRDLTGGNKSCLTEIKSPALQI